jgi:hypothetical protein
MLIAGLLLNDSARPASSARAQLWSARPSALLVARTAGRRDGRGRRCRRACGFWHGSTRRTHAAWHNTFDNAWAEMSKLCLRPASYHHVCTRLVIPSDTRRLDIGYRSSVRVCTALHSALTRLVPVEVARGMWASGAIRHARLGLGLAGAYVEARRAGCSGWAVPSCSNHLPPRA